MWVHVLMLIKQFLVAMEGTGWVANPNILAYKSKKVVQGYMVRVADRINHKPLQDPSAQHINSDITDTKHVWFICDERMSSTDSTRKSLLTMTTALSKWPNLLPDK